MTEMRKPGWGSQYALIGAGGHAKSVRAVVESVGGRVVIHVERVVTPQGRDIITDAEFWNDESWVSTPVIIAIGDNRLRTRVHRSIDLNRLAPFVAASTATVAGAEIGAGTVVHHHAHVGPGAVIAESVIVNTAAVVEHDCIVDIGAHVAPGAVLLGGVRVGEACLIGAGARVLPGIRIGDHAMVGAGAVVTADVPAGATVVGMPARAH